jgi:hypothetical protein
MDQQTAPMSPVVDQLRRVRSRARALLLGGAVATVAALFLAGVLLIGATDYLVRLPAWLRVILWVAGFGALGWGAWRLLGPVAKFRPGLTEIALRLERSEAGRKAGLPGVLASGLELSENREGTVFGGWMAEHVVEDAKLRFGRVRASSLLSLRRTRDSYMAAGVALLAAVGIAALAGPGLASTGLLRVLAPWSGAQWPKRTMLADVTGMEVHPLGTALPLRAAVLKTDQPQGETKVAARYRLIADDRAGPTHRVLLTGQGRAAGAEEQGEIYERLVEPGALASVDGKPAILEYWFESDDDRTDVKKVLLAVPPTITAAEAVVTPPAYAAVGTGTFATGRHELGTGVDQRAVVGPVLAGSQVRLKVTLNKALPGPGEDRAARAAWLSAALPGLPESAEGKFEAKVWELAWSAAESLRLPVRPADEHGIRSPEEATFSFDVIEDKPPSATVVEPREDESVLATAKVELTGEARDDVGVSAVELQARPAKPTKGSIGAAAEPVGEPRSLQARSFGGDGEAATTTQSSLSTTIEISTLGMDLKPGDEVWVYALAKDNFEIGGVRHEPVRSSPRKLRIIKEEDLLAQVQNELASVRKNVMRLDEEQGELKKAVESGTVSEDEARRQQSLSGRVSQQSQTVQRLQDRIERNQLKDEAIAGLLGDLQSLLTEASEQAQSAGAQMESAAKQAQDQERAPLKPEEQQQIEKSQDEVRDKLQQIAETLDRGEDSWVLGRTLQRLAEQQRELQQRTERAGERTMGKRPEDLSTEERSQLQEIAEQQQRLSDAAERALQQLEERSKQMEKVDATQAEGMKRAAERGRQEQVPQKMEQAQQNIEQNQTSQASAQQQEAAEALEQMLQDMNEAKRNREEALKRVLADLLQSLEKLITEQDVQIAALEKAKEGNAFAGLDAPMITLNANTLGVAEVARSDRTTVAIAELIDRAAKNQESAVAALRSQPTDAEKAEQAERESLRLLRLAKAEAQKLQDQADKAENDRKRQELRKEYRDALEEQVAIQGQTDPLIGKATDRRERLQVRSLGERQEALRKTLEEIRKKTAEMEEAGVFAYAHERLDAATGIAGKKLRAGQADQSVSRNQTSAVRILQGLLQALDDSAKEEDEFREDEGGDGGGGGGGGERPLIPPIAELKLLKTMQQEAMEQTRALDDAQQAPANDEVSSLAQFQRALHQRADELVKKLQPPNETPAPAPGQPDKE